MTTDAIRPECSQADLSFAAEALAAFLLMGVCPAGYDREDLAEFVARLTRLAAPSAGVKK